MPFFFLVIPKAVTAFRGVACTFLLISALLWNDGFILAGPVPSDATPLQKQLDEVDAQLRRPDGLYRGSIVLMVRNEPPMQRDFDLVRRGKSAYLSLRSARRGEEMRFLWVGDGLNVWSFDVVRRILAHPEEKQLFEMDPATGFAPVDFFYPWFGANLVPERLRTDSLDPNLRLIVARTLAEEWKGRLGIGIDPSGRAMRVEVTDSRGILLRVVEFRSGRPILEWKSRREFTPAWPTTLEMMDVHGGRISRFETRIYDPGFRPDPALFDPDYLSR